MFTPDDLHARWDRLIAELTAHPEVSVREAALFPSLDPVEQSELAATLGLELTPALRGFLAFSNGLGLEWRLEGSEQIGGSIHIPSFEDLNDPSKRWGPSDALEVPLDAYGLDLEEAEGHVYAFDFFQLDDDNIELAGMIPRKKGIDVFVSEDHIACITDTLLVSFGEYIDLLFRSYGSPWARAALNQGFANTKSTRASMGAPGILSARYSLGAVIEHTRSWPNVGQNRDFFYGK